MKPYYEHAGITIYNGDCREILPAILPIPGCVVVTDPPFGIAHASNRSSSRRGTTIANDGDVQARDLALYECGRHGLPAAVFGSWKRPRPDGTRAVLIWDKGAAFGMGDLSFPWKNSFEEVYILGDGWANDRRDEGVIRGHFSPLSEAQGRCHPNEKPVSLLGYLIDRHPATCVLDPFCGSGTTLRAAKDRGKKAIGIEVEEKYCEIAAKRLRQENFPFTELMGTAMRDADDWVEKQLGAEAAQ